MTTTTTAVTLTFDFEAVTPRHLIDFKRETGVSLFSLVDVETGELRLDGAAEEAVAGVIWLAMRMGGHDEATFDDALDTPIAVLDLAREDGDADPPNAG